MRNRHGLMGILVTMVLSILTVGIVATSGYGAESKKRLVVIGWGGAYDEALKKAFTEPFEKETGVEVVFVGPLDFGKIKAMVQSGKVEWDVGQGSEYRNAPAAKAGLFEQIDYKVVDKNILYPGAAQEYWCGGDYESMNIGYRKDTFKDKIPKGWKDFWDVKNFPGPRSLYKSPYYTLEAALLADGVPPNRLFPLDEERAFASLNRIKPHVGVWWTLGAQSQSLLQNKEIEMIAAWNGRIAQLIERGEPVGMIWENVSLIQGGWFVVKGSPNKKEAMEFINFTSRPKYQAIFSQLTYYGPTNPEAWKYIDSKIARHMPSHPGNFKNCLPVNYEYWKDNGDRLTEKFNAWLMK